MSFIFQLEYSNIFFQTPNSDSNLTNLDLAQTVINLSHNYGTNLASWDDANQFSDCPGYIVKYPCKDYNELVITRKRLDSG